MISSEYDFTGRVLRTKQNQSFGTLSTTVDKYFSYDSQGRLTKTEQEIADDPNGKITVAENVYNETGQLITKKLHKVGTNYLQTVDYNYNIRGWLTSINNPDNLSGDLFAEKLLYESPESGLNLSTDVQFNGNISIMIWNSDQKSKQGYRFTYDGLNRLTLGDYKYYSGAWYDHSKYEERSLTYDKNGNIATLTRSDQNGTEDAYTYHYNGNKLDYFDSKGTAYGYDSNGNTTTDGLRGMTIGYNILNLPSSISKSSESISYIYSASGEKLAKRMKDNTWQYYAGSMVYNGDKTLKYLLFEEGMVNKSSGPYVYEYHLKDHLGNTRVTFQPNGGGTTTTQVAEYYPFGSSYLPVSPAGSNKYLYNGKEKQDDVLGSVALDEYDYGARFYDPRIGRWQILDPETEKLPNWTPYRYALDNPLKFIDNNGLIEWPIHGTKAVNKRDVPNGGYGLRNTVVRTSTYLDMDRPEGSTKPHIGIDYRSSIGNDFYSLGDGKVIGLGNSTKGGNYLTVEYGNGDKVTFRHIKSVSNGIKIGDNVYEGQILGETGKSGTTFPHLHIDVKDRKGNRKDPENENYGSVTNEEFFNNYNGDYKKLRESKNKKDNSSEEDNSTGRTPWDILDSWARQKPEIFK